MRRDSSCAQLWNARPSRRALTSELRPLSAVDAPASPWHSFARGGGVADLSPREVGGVMRVKAVCVFAVGGALVVSVPACSSYPEDSGAETAFASGAALTGSTPASAPACGVTLIASLAFASGSH